MCSTHFAGWDNSVARCEHLAVPNRPMVVISRASKAPPDLGCHTATCDGSLLYQTLLDLKVRSR